MSARQWTKHFLVYGSGVVLMNLLPIVLIRIYTHAVTPAEYGVVELLNRSQDLIIAIFSFGLRATLLTFYQMERNQEHRRRALYSTALEMLAVSTLLLVLACGQFSDGISHALFGSNVHAPLVIIILASTYFEVLFQIAALYLQSELRSKAYVSTFAARALFSIIVNYVVVAQMQMGLRGIVIASAIQTIVSSVLLTAYVFRKNGFHFDRGILVDMLKFGVPLVPATLLMFIMNNGDRYFLNIFGTREQVGIYGLGYRLGMLSSNLVLMPFGKIWSVVMVNISEDAQGPQRLGKISSYLVIGLIFVNLGVGLFAPYAIAILAAPQYIEAYKVVFVVGTAYLLYAWTTIMDASFYVTKRTSFKPLILAISAVAMLSLYAILIPRFGIAGAAWATLIGFAIFAFTTLQFAQRVFFIAYEWGRMAKLLTLSGTIYLLGSWMPPFSTTSIIIRTVMLLAFVAVLWTDLISTPDERQYVREYVASILRKLKGSRGLAVKA